MSSDPLEAVSIDGEGLRFGIVASRFNRRYVDGLLEQVLRTLDEAGVSAEDIETVRAPGAMELPYLASMLGHTGEFDCLIALGVVIKGDTSHHDVIAYSTAGTFQRVSCETEVPIINGVITVNNEEQAHDRCLGKLNRGREFGVAALEMAEAKVQLVRRLDDIYGDETQQQLPGADWDGFFSADDDGEEPWKS